jgi:hypothetical protein
MAKGKRSIVAPLRATSSAAGAVADILEEMEHECHTDERRHEIDEWER